VLKLGGWKVVDGRILGCKMDSNPTDPNKYQRSFIFCEHILSKRVM